MPLANYLKMPKKQEVLALLALHWSFRRIERETGVRRETVAAYARQADPNPAKTFPGSGMVPAPDSGDLAWVDGSNPAKTFPGSDPNPAKTFPGSALPPRFAAAAYRDTVAEKLDAGLTIQRIYQDLVEDFSYGYSYESVKRYVRQLAPTRRAAGVMHSLPGEDYGQTAVMVSPKGSRTWDSLPSGIAPHNSYKASSQASRSLGRRAAFGLVDVGEPARASASRFIPRSICT